MTDRVKGCYVAFDRDIRVDDVGDVLRAIRMIRCVADVRIDGEVTDPQDWNARQRVRRELHATLMAVIGSVLTDRPLVFGDKPLVLAALRKLIAQIEGATTI